MRRIRRSRRIPQDAKPRRVKRTIERMKNAGGHHRTTPTKQQSRIANVMHKMFFGGSNE